MQRTDSAALQRADFLKDQVQQSLQVWEDAMQLLELFWSLEGCKQQITAFWNKCWLALKGKHLSIPHSLADSQLSSCLKSLIQQFRTTLFT